jgi:NosR/NirI family transcriptional regulator, nitrous oxide reductase regulator
MSEEGPLHVSLASELFETAVSGWVGLLARTLPQHPASARASKERIPRSFPRDCSRNLWRLVIVSVVLLFGVLTAPALAQGKLTEFLAKAPPNELFPSADKFGPVEGTLPAVAAYKGGQLAGYVFLNSDFADATGYSGKPIQILLGLDLKGVITGARLVEHHEPIVLIGIPPKRVTDFIAGYVGANVLQPGTTIVDHPSNVTVISGATVTVMIISDSITRAAHALAASRGIGSPGLAPTSAGPAASQAGSPAIDMSRAETENWTELLGDGSVRRLQLNIGDVNDAFAHSANEAAAQRPEPGDPKATFIDLYVALASAPVVGRSLLGPELYQQMVKSIRPGQQAILVAGEGRYSFKGSGYVRGGIFDRIDVVQGDKTIRFHDHDYNRVGEIAAEGAPHFPEIGLFIVSEASLFDPIQPWRLQLLVQRQVSALDKAYLNFDLGYTLPAKYQKPTEATTTAPARSPSAVDEPLWRKIWQLKTVDIVVLLGVIGVLTFIFFLQDIIVRRPRLTKGVRLGFLLFTVVWIGGYAHAQLSIVNVITFTNVLLGGFRWEGFLLAPLIFILWASVAASLLFWGRGAFCGWLCPFGALQELLNEVARLLRIPQVKVPWGLNERLWPVKYMAFLAIFGTSLGNMALAEQIAEIEPFKTVVVLFFNREWPFVLYGGVLLVMSLFIERFFCRYLCPLGAALAIPGRLRMFDWLKRHKECGTPCQICAKECIVQAIHPEGHINPNECHYCLYCQVLYYDDHKCPPMIQRRLKRERFRALSSASMLPEQKRKARNVMPKPAGSES